MRIIDISMEVHPQMPTYMARENIGPTREYFRTMPPDKVNDSGIRMNLHTGTHLIALPVLIRGAEGAPVRAVLVEGGQLTG